MKTFFKFLSRNKFYTFVTVFGFAVSLMFVFLITVYVAQELTIDNFQEKKDRIYLLTHDDVTDSPPLLTYRLKERYPEIEEAVSVVPGIADEPVTIGSEKINIKTMAVQNGFFDIFSVRFKKGNPKDALEAVNSAVISESFARRAFPGKDPLGQTISFKGGLVLIISGVIEDIENSVVRNYDLIFRMEQVSHFHRWFLREDLGSTAGYIFILAKEGTDLVSKVDDMNKYFKQIFWIYQWGMHDKTYLIPLKKVYFSKVRGPLNLGDKSFVLILLSIGIVILSFAVFNYVNLTVAQTGFRSHEMATRRLLGAEPEEPFMRLISESVFLTFLSLILGIFLAYLFVPVANNLLDTKLYLNNFFTFPHLIIILFFTFLLGIIAGIFPAVLMSKIAPVDVVKGTFHLRSKMLFSKIFIVVQNIITIVLITSSITITKQVEHLINAPLGYNYKNIVSISTYGHVDNHLDVLYDRLEALPQVKRIGFGQGIPLDGGWDNTKEYNGRSISIKSFWGDSIYFNILGFQVLHDNGTVSIGGKNYFSERGYQEFEIDDNALAIPDISINGKIKNFKLGNVISADYPSLVGVMDREYLTIKNILVEVQGDQGVALKEIASVFEEITHLPFSGQYMEDSIKNTFSVQQRLLKIVNIFTLIALFISLLGLIAISIYFIRQRVREIALRKVIGSTTNGIVIKLILSFLNYVVIAFVIAVPLAAYFMRNWLNDYSYQVGLSPLYFILAGIFCIVVSALTVFYQSYQAANANPVNALKNE